MDVAVTKGALAIDGGQPVRTRPFPEYRTIGEEEKAAVAEVLDSGVLSGFLGVESPQFLGGSRVRALEEQWSERFRVKHSISMNSATSGLYAAVGAAGVGPGDEVIVSPYTMTASAAAALVYSAIPVFADIDPETFCISPATIRERITPHTKAIIVVDILGHPADMDGIMALAREHDLVVIEDAAQAPGALYHGRHAGTLAHMGVFSLNRHKLIHCGEGGVVVTEDDTFADRLQLIRNHGEYVLLDRPAAGLQNMLGFNYRMTEVEAAIATEQLKKLDPLLSARQELAAYVTERLGDVPSLALPMVREGCTHAFYLYALRFDEDAFGIPRAKFARALAAEGIPVSEGYAIPLYFEPLYQQRILYGSKGYPWTLPDYKGSVSYERGICPVTERMHYSEVLTTNVIHGQATPADMDDLVDAIHKVADHFDRRRAG